MWYIICNFHVKEWVIWKGKTTDISIKRYILKNKILEEDILTVMFWTKYFLKCSTENQGSIEITFKSYINLGKLVFNINKAGLVQMIRNKYVSKFFSSSLCKKQHFVMYCRTKTCSHILQSDFKAPCFLLSFFILNTWKILKEIPYKRCLNHIFNIRRHS